MNREQPIKEIRGVHHRAAVMVVGALLGAAIWWLSPKITGEAEPWDARGNYYWIALFVAGFVSTLVSPRYFWCAPIGIYVGQFGYLLLFLPIGPLLPIGMALGLVLSVLPLIGGVVAWALVRFAASMLDWRTGDDPMRPNRAP